MPSPAALRTSPAPILRAEREAVCRPGERIVAGRPYVFNQDLLNKHLAVEAVLSAPLDLKGLTDEALRSLRYRYIGVDAMSQHDPMNSRELQVANVRLGARIEAERLRRGWVV